MEHAVSDYKWVPHPFIGKFPKDRKKEMEHILNFIKNEERVGWEVVYSETAIGQFLFKRRVT